MEEQAPKQEAVLMTFTNHKDPQSLAVKQGLLKMFYHIVLTNRLGIMEAKNSETGEEELVLVGIEQDGDAMNVFPLALPIKGEDAGKYIAPDGKGGWLEPTPEPTPPQLTLVQ
jgi:hypothetical protein